MCYTFARRLRQLLEVHVLIMEYPGYGICPGTPSEESFCQASQICLKFVVEVLGIPESDIIVLGRSLGAAVALQAAAASAVCGLVLVAPFLSLQEAVGQFTGKETSKLLVNNMFRNNEVIKSIKVPTLIIHGDQDRLVDSSQGKQLLDLCPSDKKCFVSPAGMGHNDDLLASADLLWRFVDCRSYLLELLPDPLDWRALQCACRWRTGTEDLLAEVHVDPRLRSAIGQCCRALRRLPQDDLLGDMVKSAQLSAESVRFFVTLMGARPKGLKDQVLDLGWWHAQLVSEQGTALGLWLQSSNLQELSLAECDGLLQDDGLSRILRGLGSSQLQLRHLNLCAAELCPSHAAPLVDIIARCPLETLNLAFNGRLMIPAGLEGLARAADKRVFGVQRLVLKHCEIAAKAAVPLAAWLGHMPNLRELNLDWNVELYTSLGLRGLVQGMGVERMSVASGVLRTLRVLKLQGCQLPDSTAEVALMDFLRQCTALQLLEVPNCAASQRIWSRRGLDQTTAQSVWKKQGFLQALRQSEVRECLRCLLPGPLDWRALQIACRWGDSASAGPLAEVHRRPRLRSAAVRLSRRLRGLGDLLGTAALKHSAEELRFAVEILGARPRQAPPVRLPEIRMLDLSHEHLLTGGRMLVPLQGQALGIFLRHCPQLEELRVLGHAQICTAAGLEGLVAGLQGLSLPLRTLLFGGCGVSEHAAHCLGQFLRQCPRLTSLSLAGSWQLCTAAGLRAITQTWGEDTLPLELLNLTNCRLKIPSAQALGELLRKCCFLTQLVLSGNQDFFDARAILYLLKGLGDGGLPKLREIAWSPQHLVDMSEAFQKEFGCFLRRCSLLRQSSARRQKDAKDMSNTSSDISVTAVTDGRLCRANAFRRDDCLQKAL
ncbi:abhd13 [Symbiodinium natans]|uniref:Abhd13 protein n=1 Tax=Symbiodinium natans TaxID=878477 RepID=A0A812KCC3_9DINO|nr:abhd13 [Symbiodinium natans]